MNDQRGKPKVSGGVLQPGVRTNTGVGEGAGGAGPRTQGQTSSSLLETTTTEMFPYPAEEDDIDDRAEPQLRAGPDVHGDAAAL